VHEKMALADPSLIDASASDDPDSLI